MQVKLYTENNRQLKTGATNMKHQETTANINDLTETEIKQLLLS